MGKERSIMEKRSENEEERKNLKRRRIYRRLLLAFFGCMLIFTVLSRIIDAHEVARVTTSFPARSAVTKTVEGSGYVEAGEKTGVRVGEGLLAGRISAETGAEVKTGDPLFYYDNLSLEEKRKEILAEIKGLERKIEQERLGAVRYEGVSKTELAQQELDAAGRALERQREKTERSVLEHDENLIRLKDYYEKRLALSDEELISQSRNDFDASRNEYEAAQVNQESEVKSIKRKIQNTRKKLERLQDKEDADEEDIEELEELLEEYEAELSMTSEKWDLTLTQAKEAMNDKEDVLRRARRETGSARLAIQESYEDAVKQEEKNLEAALEEQQRAADAVEAAALAVSNAKREDQALALADEQTKALAGLRCQDTQTELETKREKLKELEALISVGGMVPAPCDGTVTLCEVEQGKRLTGGERVLLSSGDLLFTGSFDRDTDGTIHAGDEVSVKFEGEQQSVSFPVEQVDLLTDRDRGTFSGKVAAGTAALGETGAFRCSKRTEPYDTVIPVGSLRKDGSGYFCLVLQPQKTILGEEYRAVRVDLELLFRGDTVAAVEGPLMDTDPVLDASDRVVNAGDRVRPVSEIGGDRA